MLRPRAWMNHDRGLSDNHAGCGVLDLPHTEFEDVRHHEPDCINYWYSNDVRHPGEPTIPEDMSQPEAMILL